MVDASKIRQLLDAGAFDEALAMLADAAAGDREAVALIAEAHERHGDMLWFHDRTGSGAPYRKAMQALLGTMAIARSAAEAALGQESWSRIAEKVLHGTGPDGRRRPAATGKPHPQGDPPRQPPVEPKPVESKPVEPKPQLVATPTAPPTRAPEPTPPPTTDAAPHDAVAMENRPAAASPPAKPTGHPEDRGPLRVGHRFRILRSFRDFDGAPWEAGTEFVYEGSSYWPRDEGFVFFTDRGGIRLCGLMTADNEILDNLDAWFAPVDP